MKLYWLKCAGDQWCRLLNVNLAHEHFDGLEGVYIIWHGAPNPAVVYVGQGNIRDRLSEHRKNPAILTYKGQELYVTWAKVDAPYRNGIEKFLADLWKPKIGVSHPDATPIEVNSPWQK